MQRIRIIFLVTVLVLLAVVVTLFCLQNNQPVSVDLLFARLDVELGLGFLCLAIFVLGGLFGLLASLPAYTRKGLELRKLRKSLHELEKKQAAAKLENTEPTTSG